MRKAGAARLRFRDFVIALGNVRVYQPKKLRTVPWGPWPGDRRYPKSSFSNSILHGCNRPRAATQLRLLCQKHKTPEKAKPKRAFCRAQRECWRTLAITV